jgi:hypothetical protein
LKKILLSLLIIISLSFKGFCYSVLTHEAIIDAAWEPAIKPLLLQKYPQTTDSQLKEALAYAYGGAVAPDMGYFPRGSKQFTNLIHYVRSGDFVNALIDEAADVNEYAFAIGVLAHYNADKYGHPLGVNICEPLIYPKVRQQYGSKVTYEQDPTDHVRTEFGFDVLQTARGNYASTAYHNFIGFKVAEASLKRAFFKTYGLNVDDLFRNFPRAVNTFRWTVKSLFPELTKAAWASKRNEIRKQQPSATPKTYRYRMSRAEYKKDFPGERSRPGTLASILSFMIRILPKVGPLKELRFKTPGPEAEKLFVQSFDTVLSYYTVSVTHLKVENKTLGNINFDTGEPTAPGRYRMTDENYGELVISLAAKNPDTVDASLKQDIRSFYSQPDTIVIARRDPQKWIQVTAALRKLSSP